LWFASMAYVLVCALRRIALRHTQFAKATCATIRLKLFKIGALVRVSVRRITLAMASGYPYQREFAAAHAALAQRALCRTRDAPDTPQHAALARHFLARLKSGQARQSHSPSAPRLKNRRSIRCRRHPFEKSGLSLYGGPPLLLGSCPLCPLPRSARLVLLGQLRKFFGISNR